MCFSPSWQPFAGHSRVCSTHLYRVQMFFFSFEVALLKRFQTRVRFGWKGTTKFDRGGGLRCFWSDPRFSKLLESLDLPMRKMKWFRLISRSSLRNGITSSWINRRDCSRTSTSSHLTYEPPLAGCWVNISPNVSVSSCEHGRLFLNCHLKS